MSDASDAGPQQLAEAVQRIDEAITTETSLRTRTEGLTWILWGLVTAGLALTFDAAFFLWGPEAAALDPWGTLLWVPWVLLGGALTSVLWRSAALSRPELEEARQGGIFVTAAYVAFIAAVWFLVLAILPHLNSDTIALLAIGTAWLFFGVWNPFHVTPTGTRVMVLQGLTILSIGVVLALLLPADPDQANRIATLVNVVFSGGVPLVGGAWQATRG